MSATTEQGRPQAAETATGDSETGSSSQTSSDSPHPSIKQRVTDTIDRLRARIGPFDHTIRMLGHYGEVNGGALAASVTYFAFLSFFPILALAFAVVGLVAHFYPAAQDTLVKALQQVLPGMIGPHGISLSQISKAAGAAAGVGLVAVIYSGLGWVSGMRTALTAVLVTPKGAKPNFFTGKLRDLAALFMIGVVMLVSVAISGVVTHLSARILGWLGLSSSFGWLVVLVSVVVGLLADMVLFFALFRLLAKPDVPARALWSGALLGAIGFEVLKQLSSFLLASTAKQPAFQAFGIALILVVWIYYFSRVVMYAAAWAYTAPQARAPRDEAEQLERSRTERQQRRLALLEQQREESQRAAGGIGFAAGVGTMMGAGLLVRRLRGR